MAFQESCIIAQNRGKPAHNLPVSHLPTTKKLRLTKDKIIRRADIKDSEILAGLAIQMWEDHTLTELSDIWKGYLLLRNIVSADTQRSFWENAKKWAKEKGCNEFASDCELINEDSLKFHMALGF